MISITVLLNPHHVRTAPAGLLLPQIKEFMKSLNNPFRILPLMLLVVIYIAAGQPAVAQTAYKLASSPDVTIKVLGTSNVHDWVMTSTVMDSKGEFTLSGENLTALRAFSFQLAVKSLKSEHESMDGRMYKSVNENKFPTISYKLNSATITTISKGKFLINSKGDLTISGVTQAINMDVTATVNTDNSISCNGSKKIQLTDYGIKPPTFMLGAMKVYNDLNIQFNLIYKK